MSHQYVSGPGDPLSESQSKRDRLVIGHVGLVKLIAHSLARRLPPSVETDDLITVGMLGLIDAAGRYQPSQGVPFDAFARRRVTGAMLDELRSLDWAPRSLRRSRRDLEQTTTRLRQQYQREPTETEIAKDMGLSEEKCTRLLDQVRGLGLRLVQELDNTDDRGEPLRTLRTRKENQPDAIVERIEMREHLAAAITELPARSQHIIALYYHEELTMSKIGEVVGVCESRISQLLSRAVSDLRVNMRAAADPTTQNGLAGHDTRRTPGTKQRRTYQADVSEFLPASSIRPNTNTTIESGSLCLDTRVPSPPRVAASTIRSRGEEAPR